MPVIYNKIRLSEKVKRYEETPPVLRPPPLAVEALKAFLIFILLTDSSVDFIMRID